MKRKSIIKDLIPINNTGVHLVYLSEDNDFIYAIECSSRTESPLRFVEISKEKKI